VDRGSPEGPEREVYRLTRKGGEVLSRALEREDSETANGVAPVMVRFGIQRFRQRRSARAWSESTSSSTALQPFSRATSRGEQAQDRGGQRFGTLQILGSPQYVLVAP
jgi:hypothetical protein